MKTAAKFAFACALAGMALGEFSCVDRVPPQSHCDSDYTKMGLVEIAVLSGSNRVETGEFIRATLKSNGIVCVVEGSLEHWVRVPNNDARSAVAVLKRSGFLQSHQGRFTPRDP